VAKAKTDTGEKKLSQRAMVQVALDELGMDAKPQALQDVIKNKFQVELSAQRISLLKSQIKKKSGLGPGRGSHGGLQIEDLAIIRRLVVRLGAAQMKQLVDVLA
jgi:hypothetical protein